MWAIFDTMEIFDTWHTAVKEEIGYPIYGHNVETGEIDYENPTTEYTSPVTCEEDPRVIAWVGDRIQGLTIINKNDYPWFFPHTIG